MNAIKIIFEDDFLLVIEKPAGITVNKSDTTKNELTVQDLLEEKFSRHNLKFSKNDIESDFYKRAGIVHRLDKETSGLLLIAKTLECFENLQLQFKERKVKKTYIALAHGKVEPKEGEIRVPVGRLPWNRTRFGVLAGGKDALTRYTVISTYQTLLSNKQKEQLSLLELNPETGRTHQIRVHLKYFGHPIFSDPLYAGRKTSRDDRKFLPRIFLHAKLISFFHPKTGERVTFESPLPKELDNFLKVLSKD